VPVLPLPRLPRHREFLRPLAPQPFVPAIIAAPGIPVIDQEEMRQISILLLATKTAKYHARLTIFQIDHRLFSTSFPFFSL
jgi:hypothetical protein